MSLESLDKNIKSSIYSYESDVPDGIWDSIDKQLRPKKNRWLLWFFASIPVLGLSIFLKLNLYPGHSAEPANQLPNTPITYYGQTVDALSSADSEITIAASQTSLTDQTPDAKKIDGPELPTKTALGPREETKEKQKNLTGPQIPNASLGFQSVLNFHKGLVHRQVEGLVQSNPSATFPKVLEADADQIRKATLITPLEGRLLQLLRVDPKIDVCPTFSSTLRITSFFELTLLGGLANRSFDLRDQEQQDYQDLREDTEKVRSTLTLQALIGLDIGDRLEIKSGLGLTRVYEVFDYIDQSATRTITNIITDTILENGVPVIRSDTSIVTEYGQRIKLSQNRYTYLDLPILAAYKFKVRQHSFFIQGGASLNLLLRTKGDILAPDKQITSIDSRDRNIYPVYKDHIGIDLLGSIGYEYEFKERNALRLMLSIRHSLSDITIDAYPLAQRYDHIQLGIAWKHQF